MCVGVDFFAECVQGDGYSAAAFVDKLADLGTFVDGYASRHYDRGSDDDAYWSRRRQFYVGHLPESTDQEAVRVLCWDCGVVGVLWRFGVNGYVSASEG